MKKNKKKRTNKYQANNKASVHVSPCGNAETMAKDFMLFIHFQELMENAASQTYEEYCDSVDSLTCFDCHDYKSKLCPGKGYKSEQCLECVTDLKNKIFGFSNGETEYILENDAELRN